MKLKERYPEFIEHLRTKGYKEHSLSEYERFLYGSLSHSIQDIELENLKLMDTDKVIEAGKKHGFYGAQRSVCCYRNYLRFLQRNGVRFSFDWRDIEVPKVPHRQQPVFDIEEMLKIFEAFPIRSGKSDVKRMAWSMRALYETLFGTGMRVFEALSLRRDDFIRIKQYKELTIIGKGGDERIVFFTERSIFWMNRYLEQRHDIGFTMFINGFGDPLKYVTAKSWTDRFKANNQDLPGIEKLKLHTPRRTLATYLFEKNADIKSVQAVLGHKSERTTLRHYVRNNIKRAKEVHKAIMDRVDNSTIDN